MQNYFWLVWISKKLIDIRTDINAVHFWKQPFNPLDSGGNYSATSKLVHWPLMGGLLHLVHWGGAWAGCSPAQSLPRCNICNSPLINGQCTNHRIAIIWCMVRFSAVLMWRIKRIKGLISTSQMTILLLDYRLTMYLSSRSSSFKTIEIQIKYRKKSQGWMSRRERSVKQLKLPIRYFIY